MRRKYVCIRKYLCAVLRIFVRVDVAVDVRMFSVVLECKEEAGTRPMRRGKEVANRVLELTKTSQHFRLRRLPVWRRVRAFPSRGAFGGWRPRPPPHLPRVPAAARGARRRSGLQQSMAGLTAVVMVIRCC